MNCLNHPTNAQLKDTFVAINRNSLFTLRSHTLHQSYTAGLTSLYILNLQTCLLHLRLVPPHFLDFLIPFDCLVILHGLYTQSFDLKALNKKQFETCNRLYESDQTLSWILETLVFNSKIPNGLLHNPDCITDFITRHHNPNYFQSQHHIVNCIYQALCADNTRYMGHTTDIHRLISGSIELIPLIKTDKTSDHFFTIKMSPESFLQSGRIHFNDPLTNHSEWLDCLTTLGKLPSDIAYDITRMSYKHLTHCQCHRAEIYNYDMSTSCVYILQMKFTMTNGSEAFCTLKGIVRTSPQTVQQVIRFTDNLGKEYNHNSVLLHGNHFPQIAEYEPLYSITSPQYMRTQEIMSLIKNALIRPHSTYCKVQGKVALFENRIHSYSTTIMEPLNDVDDHH
jgi:hypothetical protein